MEEKGEIIKKELEKLEDNLYIRGIRASWVWTSNNRVEIKFEKR
jgi:hypothetical protein